MKEPIFTGSGVEIVTPFFDDNVNLMALGELLDFHLANGTDAVIVCGISGEASTMSYWERMRTVEFCIDYVSGRIPVIAGSGSTSTENAIQLSRDAETAGADGLLVVTPYYNRATQPGLIRHYNAIADLVKIPILLCNAPSCTGVSLTPETCAELAKHPNIQGMEDTSGDLSFIQRTRNLCPETFYLWSGNDDETVPFCAFGGQGVISVAANILPREMHTLVRLCVDNDFHSAGQLQLELKEFFDTMSCEVSPIPVKAAMNLLGFPAGSLRLPLCSPTEGDLIRILRVLERYGLGPAELA